MPDMIWYSKEVAVAGQGGMRPDLINCGKFLDFYSE